MMLTTTSPEYDDARLGYQRRNPHRPEVIFPVTDATEVEEAVRYAIDHDKKIAVQASGHGLTGGIDGGVLIATAAFNQVTVDPDRKTAWIEAGATWRDVMEATAPYGLAPLSGSFPGVGAISYTLGGGLGLMARRFGYAADHVRRIELVTMDGIRRDADPDLFWATRGGGGNFGVVTGMEIELFDVPTLYGGSLYFDLAEHPDVLEVWREWTKTVPDEVTTAMALVPLPDIPAVPPALRGKYIAQVQLVILGDDGEELIRPLRAIGQPAMDTVGELPYVESEKIFAEPDRPDSFSTRNVLVSDLDPTSLATLPKLAGPEAPTRCVVAIRQLGGALTREPAVANAVCHRDAAYSITLISPGGDGDSELQNAVLEPWHELTVGRLLNFNGGGIDLRDVYDEGTFTRLTELREQYDPERRLQANHQL
ncbi:FAD-binding oxidoreductase [Kribbella sp. NBC_00662]|uniref:FAD-binding oxidoreductase n=1 Tax=Kribbella sp. NBC_00662 TaxID=2975969 RepID=UPI00324CDEEF